MDCWTRASGCNTAGGVPFSSGGNSAVNSLKLVSSDPNASCGQFSSTERMACVAHALLMTWWSVNRWLDAFEDRVLPLWATACRGCCWSHLVGKEHVDRVLLDRPLVLLVTPLEEKYQSVHRSVKQSGK
jgi:hypothetical protein